MKFTNMTLATALAVALLAGCDRDNGGNVSTPPNGADNAARTGGDVLPAGLVLASAPEGAQDVAEVKRDAAAGKEVVVKGVVAGAKEPIAENRAVFTLADASLDTCDKTPGDSCETPWDACCAEPGTIAAKSVSVQVVGADGKPLKTGLKGAAGLAPLQRVVVKGKVRSVEGEGDKRIVTLDAGGIHVVR